MTARLSDLISSDPEFEISVGKIPPPTAKDIAQANDLEGCDRRKSAKLWKEERTKFNRLKRLASAIGIERVIVSPESAVPTLYGLYVPSEFCQLDLNPSQWAREWGLSKSQIRMIRTRTGANILIDYHSCDEPGASPTLAHEIGHHLYRLAQFTEEEQKTPVTVTMKGFFPHDEYVHQSRDEICAQCFAEFFTKVPLRKAVEKHCESILQRVSFHDPAAVKHVLEYRLR